jgi:nucleolar protein 4
MADSGSQQHDARTVFVRNVGFHVDESQLEQVFADVGPVRQCFLVKQKGEQRHKGIAFVQYAIPEDADRAVEELNGKEVSGRKLKVRHTLQLAAA